MQKIHFQNKIMRLQFSPYSTYIYGMIKTNFKDLQDLGNFKGFESFRIFFKSLNFQEGCEGCQFLNFINVCFSSDL